MSPAADRRSSGLDGAMRLEVDSLCVPGGVSLEGSLEGSLTGDVVAVGIPVYESGSGPVIAGGLDASSPFGGDDTDTDADADTDGTDARSSVPSAELFARQGFSGKPGQTLAIVQASGAPSVVYLGCGSADAVGLGELRRAAAALVRYAGRFGCAAILLPSSLAENSARARSRDAHDAHRLAAHAVAVGAVLAAYKFSAHKTADEDRSIERLIVAGVGLDERALIEGVSRGVRVARWVCLARDMVNEPPSSMTPSKVADVASQLATSSTRTTLEVWDAERITDEHLGGLLGVARGSAEPPRLVRVEYEPDDPVEVDGHVPHVVLVGKGITFDSGGLSLKTADGMATMKTDMSGAAAVLATVFACSDLGVRVRVTAIAPLTENMPGGRATKPGDVLEIRDGQTIEVLNTDAEGRLVLADGLSLAAELEPDAIIDLATLTGAAVVSLGRAIAGIFSNDDSLAARLESSAVTAGEAMWRLPLAAQYKSHFESEVADMKNIGKPGQAGAIVAALILERFTKGVPWVHIDMAGPARSDQDDGLLSKGGTGFGVQTLLELLSSYDRD